MESLWRSGQMIAGWCVRVFEKEEVADSNKE